MKKVIYFFLFCQLISCSISNNWTPHDPCDDYFLSTKFQFKTIVRTDSNKYNLEYIINNYRDSLILHNPTISVIQVDSRDTIYSLNNGFYQLNLEDGQYDLLVNKDKYQSLVIPKVNISQDSIQQIVILLGPDCDHIIKKLDLRTW